MKKLNNNKFRGNTIYSLNYKFDSVSSAGKLSGTALDLIKRYNELAKEAHNNGDYVQMEVFRQYAEHYRKIVTEINERKNQSKDNTVEQENSVTKTEEQSDLSAQVNDTSVREETVNTENNLVETEAAEPTAQQATKSMKKTVRKRSFTVIDVAAKEAVSSDNVSDDQSSEIKTPRRKIIRRRSSEKIEKEQSE